MVHPEKQDWRLQGKRILVCGKGGSGKSTLVALMAVILERKYYEVMVLDGDASNPEGLIRLLFGKGIEGGPKPLIEFFGGIHAVHCPVDDPAPLTRINDPNPVPQKRIAVGKEIPPAYYLRKGGITFLQVGKIETYGQGCDGPLEKVVRDFMIEGKAVSLIDMKAGVEHFGRRIPDRMDIVVGVLDPTLESVAIAKRMSEFCQDMGMGNFWLVLNKMGTAEVASILNDRLEALRDKVIGLIPYDYELTKAALSGQPIGESGVTQQVGHIVERLERVI